MNVIGIGNYGLFNSNYAKITSTEEVQASTSFADIVQNKLNDVQGGCKHEQKSHGSHQVGACDRWRLICRILESYRGIK